MKIHITILGKETLPLFYPIKKFEPDIVYILATSQNKTQTKVICDYLKNLSVTCHVIEVFAYDIKNVVDACESIHNRHSSIDEYIYNITGGTKPMAIGALDVARKQGAKIIYTESTHYIDFDTFESMPMETTVDNRTIFALQGQKLKEYHNYEHSNSRTESSQMILEFVTSNRKVYDVLMKQYKDIYNKNIPNRFQVGKINYQKEGNRIIVEYDDIEVLNIQDDDVKMLLFEGRWWETLVADAIANWSAGKYEIWHSVKFKPKEEDGFSKDKNEVDILVNIGNTLVFIECKSGNITQDNVYKMEYVRQTYGSEKSKSVLFSFYPINKHIKEKLKDSLIDSIAPNSLSNQSTFLMNVEARMVQIVESLKL